MFSFQGSPLDVLKDERVQYWIENYRNLLDAWRFWHKRAEFDIHRSKLDPSSKPLAQVSVLFWRESNCNVYLIAQPKKEKCLQPVIQGELRVQFNKLLLINSFFAHVDFPLMSQTILCLQFSCFFDPTLSNSPLSVLHFNLTQNKPQQAQRILGKPN